ncbi:MAG: Rrf2 family transcriptional regulator, iron-sulfur cluster assembly transcription factor [Campylobacterota bacterium]|nr:Rrf2 family transcriptional regulator, iron-sulfur cluster assembly transcription factor [Campylobacterota bacterium]
MLLTKASEYALLSIALIAQSKEPQDTKNLAEALKIPKSFLAKILQSLARSEILISYKGAKGGFILSKTPAEISVLDIIKSVEIKSANVFECSDSQNDCPGGNLKASCCFIWPCLNKLQGKVDDFLDSVKLEDLLNI